MLLSPYINDRTDAPMSPMTVEEAIRHGRLGASGGSAINASVLPNTCGCSHYDEKVRENETKTSGIARFCGVTSLLGKKAWHLKDPTFEIDVTFNSLLQTLTIDQHVPQ